MCRACTVYVMHAQRMHAQINAPAGVLSILSRRYPSSPSSEASACPALYLKHTHTHAQTHTHTHTLKHTHTLSNTRTHTLKHIHTRSKTHIPMGLALPLSLAPFPLLVPPASSGSTLSRRSLACGVSHPYTHTLTHTHTHTHAHTHTHTHGSLQKM